MAEPQVGIAVAVYNSAAFLKDTLDSILAQTFTDFTLYLSDDGSTDGSVEICREYANRDSRVRFTANEENIGAIANHRKLLAMAETEYFMFVRCHEIIPPNFLADGLDILRNDPEVVLTFPRSRWIDQDNNLILNKHLCFFDTRGMDVVSRSALVFWGKYEAFYGLGLTENFRRVRVLEEIVGHDLIMLLEMSMLGTFAVIENGSRLRRYNYQEDYRERIKRYQETTLTNAGWMDRHFPFIKMPFYLVRSIFGANISFGSKCLLTLVAFVCAPVKFLVSRGKPL